MQQPPKSPDQQPADDAHDPVPHCYRHPDRETGIRCTRCDKPICTDCMVSASVGFQCPDCVRGGSGTGHAPTANQPRNIVGSAVRGGDPRLVTKILLGINLLVFALTWIPDTGQRVVDELLLVGAWPPPPYLVSHGVAAGEWYRLFTSVFLHQEIWHIAFNMLSLWWLGGPLEAALGRARFTALYLVSGLAGSALTYAVTAPGSGSLGASGAIFGLFGATAVLMKRMKYDMRPVLALLVINLIITFGVPGISWTAHIGGLVAGVLLALGLVYAPRDRRALVQAGTFGLVFVAVLVTVLVRTATLVS
ncbi:rhomboid family intramembrane serine protease [Streptomyces sp. NBC_00237]|uniref:rhomboid family intramembrane serine protease n=1 Tax=Streptomyces sp. NBC_00237 TaxID=2975687 RepID=UPI0022572801|nr:rhomboid family intramembrane serine protease [Streptomyces sp. NBC_00237]MCX5200094.1 rhomboid family intramembrane serine protease [Streptomyces sp. NBC_00237]